MKNTIKIISGLLLSVMFASSVNATLFSIELDQTDFNVGQTLTANLVVSDIEKDSIGFTSLIADFELDLMFDNSLLSFDSLSFGEKLGDGLDSLQLDNVTASGILNIFELSYLLYDELLVLQDGISKFTLASINFDIINVGSGLFSLNNIATGNDIGTALTDIQSNSTSFITTSGATAIPEPTSVALILVGLMLVQVRRMIK
ncbi:MAG: PEP-CTERM sorting domain-containing protein [Gammaproteobacteria bacterium]|nr:PEP-CTERM sorting domain-containing protein [Gammaproteobacteria bacterium]